jgi:aminoglycoside 2'-N-acetyltransferase I
VPPVRLIVTQHLDLPVLAATRAMVFDAFEDDFDGEFTDHDWAHTEGGWRVVALDGDVPVSHAAVVARTMDVGARRLRTGYVEGVATAPARRREGLGTRVMTEIGAIVRAEFEMGALSTGSWRFYQRLGWERWRGPTFVRDGEHLVRTEDEDDGVMVLRFGPSAGVDLGSPITCEARAGDDW